MAFCGNCGNELREGASYCPKCGIIVKENQEQEESDDKRFLVPWIAAFAVLTILIGSYFVTDMVSPETHKSLFGWVTFGNSPSNTVKKAFSCLKDYDLDGYLDYVYFGKNPSEKEIEGKKAMILAFGKEKMEKTMDERGGLKDFDITSEKINGDNATVECVLFYGKGDKEKKSCKLRKNNKGDWLIDND